jgi:hypothetical protein
MHALLITLLLASDAPNPDIGHAVQTIELGKLRWDQARRLNGRRVRIVFKVESVALSTSGLLLLAKGYQGTTCRIRLGAGEPCYIPGEMTVDGIIRARHKRVIEIGGGVTERRELEVLDAHAVVPRLVSQH